METKIIKNIQIVETWHAASLLAALLLCPIVLPAQNGVTVSNLAVNAGTVTFDVRWDKNTMPPEAVPWSDSVWVFVDYNNNGVMVRLPLLPGATLTATSPGGEVIEEPGNNKGVWVVGNARSALSGAFSATVQLLTATVTADFSGACAYASNYPPVGDYTSATNISFKGTPPYDMVLKHEDGSTTVTQSGSNYYVPASYTVQSFSDKTGAPGLINCLPPAPPTVVNATFCFGLPGQLQAAASGSATVAWYDAPTAGNLLYTGNVLPLTPLYNSTAQYYAQAVSEDNCPSARTQVNYVVNHCVLNGYCPGFESGTVGFATAPEAACSTFDSGKIGLVNYQATCEVFYPGQIGSKSYQAACVSYDAGWIGQ